jgi:ribonucleotide reductase alpha subunit
MIKIVLLEGKHMTRELCGIKLNMDRDSLFDELGKTRLKDSYMRDDETSPQERFAFVSKQFSSNPEHAQRLYDYASKHWLSYATPLLSFGRSKRGLPISCFLNYIEDTAEGLVENFSETSWLSMLGGGVGIGFGIRSASEKSTGVMPHLKTYDASSLAYRQGSTRRGSYAAYLDISHPDIIAFIEMRKPTGDQNMRCLNLHHGINITDKFMNIIELCMFDENTDDSWELIDPASKQVVEVVSAREIWQRIIEMRMQNGEPYLHFIDESNREMPSWLKRHGLQIKQSNLCVTGDTEITVFDTFTNKTVIIHIDEFIQMYQPERWKIWSYNTETKTCEWKWVTDAAMTNPSAEILEIEDEATGKILRCTPEHQVYTKNRGYVMAKDLVEDDELVISYKGEKNMLIKIRKLEAKESVYDLTVEGNHNFFANDILVHNCTEIMLPTDENRTAVCCLSSVNLEYYDDWKDDELFLRDIAEMLDNALEYFIDNAPDQIARAKFSAMRERSIGIGALGWHALLQKNNLPWESPMAIGLNKTVFKNMQIKLNKANLELGIERGEAPDASADIKFEIENGQDIGINSSTKVTVSNPDGMRQNVHAFQVTAGQELIGYGADALKVTATHKPEGVGYRFSHTSAIAPNATSSIIMGNTSPSVEPFRANCYRQDTISGSSLNKNKYLDRIIQEEAKKHNASWADDTWRSILANDGSVQHLDWMDDWTKSVFKTAMEIDQRWIIQHAADRQEYIDQGQSINVFFRPDSPVKYVHAVHFMAWKYKLKSLYYCRSDKIIKADKISKKIEREIIKGIDLKTLAAGDECLACSG